MQPDFPQIGPFLVAALVVFAVAQSYTAMHAPNAAYAQAANAAYPLTVGIVFVQVGYYVCFYSWVLWKSKRLDAGDIETDSAALTQ